MSAIEQGKAVVKTIRGIIGGLTQARGAAGRAADEKSEITSDVDAVKSAGKEVTEGVTNLKSAGSKLDADVKATAANVSADIAAVKGVTTPAAPKPGAAAKGGTAPAAKAETEPAPKADAKPAAKADAKPAPKAEAPKAAAPKPAPSAPKADPKPKA